MKNRTRIQRLLIFTAIAGVIVFQQALTQSPNWATEWFNNGSGNFTGWVLNTADRYLGGSLTQGGQDNLMFIKPNGGWATVKKWQFGAQGTTWYDVWSNAGNGTIGSLWAILYDDKYALIDNVTGANTSYLLPVNNRTRWAAILKLQPSGGGGWTWATLWHNSGGSWIGGWWINPDDHYLAGNFNSSTSQHEVLSVSNGVRWAMLQYFNGSSWSVLWHNGGNGWIGGWNISANDRYVYSDFDGDGTDELLCVNPANGYAGLYRYNGSGWTGLWGNSGNGWIGNWQIGYTEYYAAGNIDDGTKSELFSANYGSGWVMVQKYTGSGWSNMWNNGGGGWFNGWSLSSNDRYGISDFIGTGSINHRLVLFNPQTGYAGMMRYNRNSSPANSLSDGTQGDNARGLAAQIPKEFALYNNHPNPFNPETKITFALAEPSIVKLTIFDVLGREVAVLEDGHRPAGFRSVQWNGRNRYNEPVSSGMYFYRLTAVGESGKNFVETKKMLMTK